ncbi:MAG: hypothetical protein NVS9B1_06720 [Candidatus Dormibacteraceae bacterium]
MPHRRLAGVALLFVLVACGGGQASTPAPVKQVTPAATAVPSPAPTTDIAALAALFAGTYRGSWTNKTFGSTGPVEAVITLDRSTLTVQAVVTIGGNVFGGAAPAPETFTGKLGGVGALGFSGHSPTFGDFTITANGPLFTMKAINIPNPRIDHLEANGTLTGTSIDSTYKVFFKDGTTADGTATMAKVA